MKVLYGEGVANHTSPEVMRAGPRGWHRSVDRGTCRLGIEPRKNQSGRRRRSDSGRPHEDRWSGRRPTRRFPVPCDLLGHLIREQMVKCSKAEMRWLKTALRWKIPASQRQRIQMAQRRALSPTFRTGSDAAHYPLAGVGAADFGAALLDRREPLIFLFSKFRCGPIDGARAVELLAATGSLHIGAGRERTGRGAQRRALSPTFRTGSDAAHYPLAGWAPRIWRGAARPARAADFSI